MQSFNETFEISVIIPIYNGEETLNDSLVSVLDQKVSNTEVIIIDDGSIDTSFTIAKAISNDNPSKDILIHKQKNKGLAASLNVGIGLASGKYIARQDQDDLVLPERFVKQFDFLEQNNQVGIVGTWAQIYEGDKETQRYHNHASSSHALKLELLFDNPFVHSSIMMRKSALDNCGGYSEDTFRQPPEDYELWSRIAKDYEIANIPEVLTVYREMPSSMSRTGVNPFLNNVLRISAENIYFRISPTYSYDQCLRLSQIYHGAECVSSLSNKTMQKMLLQAAIDIAGCENDWSDEFKEVFKRISKHLLYRSVSNQFPEKVLTGLRIIRSYFRKLG
ncbi:MAG: glycosyltransferase involved in cell wall biosynthesis [Mariniflexile sp.]|jgi:glycosyltransferase involved in cell wall biosynthesis